MKNIFAVIFLATSLLLACKSSQNTSSSKAKGSVLSKTEIWVIASQKVKCDEAAEAMCFQVKRAGQSEYQQMNVEIENFSFEPGYKYQLQVNVVPSKSGEVSYVMLEQYHKVASK